MSTKLDLIKRLEPFSQGCFSGNISEWPQLKPLLKDIYEYLCVGVDASQCINAASTLGIDKMPPEWDSLTSEEKKRIKEGR